ncbi:MAG TPA: DinB family protein [Chitinophagaceae bacterium]|nr:DinB family protein [Chitinophagaceae bacterium]
MTFIDFFRQQLEAEGAITRKFLERVPDDKYDFKPHERSMVIKDLVTHIADLPGWFHLTLTTKELDFANGYDQPDINTNKELLAFFDKRYQEGLSMLVPENEKQLSEKWVLRNGEKILWEDTKLIVLRSSMSQQIHHRAQLGVYLRLLNIPIPGSYGPSADENDFM